MIQISTLSSNTFEQLLFNYSNKNSSKTESLDFNNNALEVDLIPSLNQVAESLPKLQESPSDACIEAILAFSRKTAME